MNSELFTLRLNELLAFAVGTALIIGGTLLAFVFFSRAPPESLSTIRSLAVLPLKNVPDDSNYEYLSDGITESNLLWLLQSQGLLLKINSHTV
jgi:hypothetical protein